MLKVEQLTVYFGKAIAVNNITLNVGDDEIVGIFGSNGAGKSTLTNTLSGVLLEKAEKEARKGGERISIFGRIEFNGKLINNLNPWNRIKLGIALCPERRRIFPEMTVLENLMIGAYLRSNKKDIKKDLEFILKLFPSLRERLSQVAGFLSGGEQQMLAIGRALMSSPVLLMLDEPLLGLAPKLQYELLDTIRYLQSARNISILIAEQYIVPTINIIDRGYIMENGVLTISGTKEELIENQQVKSAYLGI